jgi:hypothetical protein
MGKGIAMADARDRRPPAPPTDETVREEIASRTDAAALVWQRPATSVPQPPTLPASGVGPPVTRPCPSCGRDWGGGTNCQFCRQVEGLPQGVYLSSPAKRLGGYVLEGILLVVTLGLGWLVWTAFAFRTGQTPAKKLLSMRVVKLRTARSASWGLMFVREIIAKPIVGVLSLLTIGIINFWLLWDRDNQELWDKLVGVVVVNDSAHQLP